MAGLGERSVGPSDFCQQFAATTSSVFSQRLPREEQEVVVELQRGARVAISTPRSPRSARAAPSRRYELTVLPDARIKPKKAVTQSNSRKSLGKDPAAACALEERALFRKDRFRRFQACSRFPALVSSMEIVPTWKTAMAVQKEGDGCTPTGRRRKSLVASSTLSQRVKRRERAEVSNGSQWHVSSLAGADSWTVRKPVLHEEVYDPRPPYIEEKKGCWLGETTILPPSQADAGELFDLNRWHVHEEVAAYRAHGRQMTAALQEDYETRRRHWQQMKSRDIGDSWQVTEVKRVTMLQDEAKPTRHAELPSQKPDTVVVDFLQGQLKDRAEALRRVGRRVSSVLSRSFS